MSPTPIIFDTALVRAHWQRAKPRLQAHRALIDDVAEQMTDRLGDIRQKFDTILDLSPLPFLDKATIKLNSISDDDNLSLPANQYDLIVSNFALQWINDVPGSLAQIHAALKTGGLFMAAFPGGNTLHELRTSLLEAEITIMGGASPRVSPTIDLLTASQLLQRAGFILPVADQENVTMLYPNLRALMHDLRGMGQGNAQMERSRRFSPRHLFTETENLYRARFAEQSTLAATFDIIHLHGWKAD